MVEKRFSFPTAPIEVQNYTSWSHAYFRINRDKDNEMLQLPGLFMDSLLGLVERVGVISLQRTTKTEIDDRAMRIASF